MTNLTCPISIERLDENATRIGAFIVLIIALFSLWLNLYWLYFFLAADFALRTFTTGSYSIIKNASKLLSKKLKLPVKLTNAAPKKFAAGVGLLFAITIGGSLLLELTNTAYIVGAILIICAFLESFFAYCIGCVVYSYFVQPLIKITTTK